MTVEQSAEEIVMAVGLPSFLRRMKITLRKLEYGLAVHSDSGQVLRSANAGGQITFALVLMTVS